MFRHIVRPPQVRVPIPEAVGCCQLWGGQMSHGTRRGEGHRWGAEPEDTGRPQGARGNVRCPPVCCHNGREVVTRQDHSANSIKGVPGIRVDSVIHLIPLRGACRSCVQGRPDTEPGREGLHRRWLAGPKPGRVVVQQVLSNGQEEPSITLDWEEELSVQELGPGGVAILLEAGLDVPDERSVQERI